jgi:hypothetical protein
MSAANPFNLVRAFREFGVRGTAQKLWQMRTIKFGRHVGTDINGKWAFQPGPGIQRDLTVPFARPSWNMKPFGALLGSSLAVLGLLILVLGLFLILSGVCRKQVL